MKKFFTFSAYTLLGFCGLIALTAVILKLISDEQYKEWAAAAVESATGRELAIEGPFSLQFGSSLYLLAQDISLSNAEWGSRDHMITADQLFVEISLLPLFKGVLDLTVELDGPDVLLETNDKGDGNWSFAPSGVTAPEPETAPEHGVAEDGFILPFKPYIRNFKISNFLFAFSDPATNQAIEAHLDLFRVFVDKTEGLPLILNGVYQGAPVILEGMLGNVNNWYANKQTPIVLKGKLNEADLAIEGTAGPLFPQPAARLDISLQAEEISTFSLFAGINLPELTGLNISATALASGGLAAVENITIKLSDPQLTIDITGDVTDLNNVSGINLKADIATDQGTALSEKLGALNIESIPDKLVFAAGLSGDLDTLSMTDLRISIKDQGVDINLSGSMENILKLEGAEASLTARIESLDIIGGYIGQDLPGFGPMEMSARIISPDQVTQLESLVINLTDPTLSAQVNAATGHITVQGQNNLAIDSISVTGSAESNQLEGIVKKLGLELPVALPSSISFETAAAGNLDTLALDSFELTIKDEGVDLHLSATAENVLDQSGIIAMLTTDVASTANLSKFAGMEIADLGSVVVKGQVSSAGQTFKLDTLDFQLQGEDLQARLNGTIQDLLVLTMASEELEKIGTAGIDLSFDANVSSISKLITEITGLEAHDLGTLKLNGHVNSVNEMLALDSFDLQLNGADLNAQVKAAIQNMLVLAKAVEEPQTIGTAGVDLSLNADIASISEFTANLTGLKIPDLGGLQINGQAHSAEQALELKSLSAVLKHEGLEANLEATIADIFTLAGIKTSLSAKVDSLQTLSSITKTELPETGPWLLNVRASSAGLNKSPLLFNASLEGEQTKTVVDATIPDPKAPRTILAKLIVDAESLALLGTILDKDLPGDQPLKVSTNIAVSPDTYNLEKVMVLLGQGEILSNLTYTTALEGEAGRKNLTGQVSIKNLDITPFLTDDEPPPEEGTESAQSAAAAEEKSRPADPAGDKRIFSSTPLMVGAFQDYDIDLSLDAKDFTIHEGFSIHGNTAVKLDKGLLTIDPFNFSGVTGGSANGVITLDAREAMARLDVFLDFNEFVLPKLGGTFSLDADLEAEGDSVAALMGSLDGFFVAHINDAELVRTSLTKFGAGLTSNFNPLKKDRTTLECAIARFDIKDGMAQFENKIAAQTTDVTWIGGGDINLKTEEIDVGMAPKARKIISSMTNLDLASLIHIGGTLAEPDFGIDTLDVAKKYAQYSAYIATGGLSWLAQKAYDNRQSNRDHCERILADLKEK